MTLKFQTIFLFVLASFFLESCSSGGREERKELRTLFSTGSYDQALLLIDKSKFYKDQNEKLLALMEKATIYHAKGDWETSSLIFDEAKSLQSALYNKLVEKSGENST